MTIATPLFHDLQKLQDAVNYTLGASENQVRVVEVQWKSLVSD